MNAQRQKTFDKAMMDCARALAANSTCLKRKVGCVLTERNFVVATGFNGSVSGAPHCDDTTCCIYRGHCVNTVHAETNAAMRCQSADTAYCTSQPCLPCLKLLLARGVKKIHYLTPYVSKERNAYLKYLTANGYQVPQFIRVVDWNGTL